MFCIFSLRNLHSNCIQPGELFFFVVSKVYLQVVAFSEFQLLAACPPEATEDLFFQRCGSCGPSTGIHEMLETKPGIRNSKVQGISSIYSVFVMLGRDCRHPWSNCRTFPCVMTHPDWLRVERTEPGLVTGAWFAASLNGRSPPQDGTSAKPAEDTKHPKDEHRDVIHHGFARNIDHLGPKNQSRAPRFK